MKDLVKVHDVTSSQDVEQEYDLLGLRLHLPSTSGKTIFLSVHKPTEIVIQKQRERDRRYGDDPSHPDSPRVGGDTFFAKKRVATYSRGVRV